jgi:hypothetical protein
MLVIPLFARRVAAAAVLLAGLGACSKSGDVAPAPKPLGVSWTVDGVSVKTTDGYMTTGGTTSTTSYVIGTVLADGSGLTLNIAYPPDVGT